MKIKKISLNQLAIADLNERELCRLWGGGDPGCCQCGCNYANSGGSSSYSNGLANNAYGYTSDPGAVTCQCECKEEPIVTLCVNFNPLCS